MRSRRPFNNAGFFNRRLHASTSLSSYGACPSALRRRERPVGGRVQSAASKLLPARDGDKPSQPTPGLESAWAVSPIKRGTQGAAGGSEARRIHGRLYYRHLESRRIL